MSNFPLRVPLQIKIIQKIWPVFHKRPTMPALAILIFLLLSCQKTNYILEIHPLSFESAVINPRPSDIAILTVKLPCYIESEKGISFYQRLSYFTSLSYHLWLFPKDTKPITLFCPQKSFYLIEEGNLAEILKVKLPMYFILTASAFFFLFLGISFVFFSQYPKKISHLIPLAYLNLYWGFSFLLSERLFFGSFAIPSPYSLTLFVFLKIISPLFFVYFSRYYLPVIPKIAYFSLLFGFCLFILLFSVVFLFFPNYLLLWKYVFWLFLIFFWGFFLFFRLQKKSYRAKNLFYPVGSFLFLWDAFNLYFWRVPIIDAALIYSTAFCLFFAYFGYLRKFPKWKFLQKRREKIEGLYRDLAFYVREVRHDLLTARKFQQKMLPDPGQINQLPLKIRYYYHPLQMVGGDIYFVQKLSNEKVRIFLADAAGHSIEAALITMAIKGEFDAASKANILPGKLLSIINKKFMQKYQQLETFFTALVCDIDCKEQKIYYAAGGHPAQLLISEGKLRHLKHTGPLLGVLPDAKYPTRKGNFCPGDSLLLFTDGLLEQTQEEAGNKKEFGEKKLSEIFLALKGCDASDIADIVETEILRYIADGSQGDDITVIAITY